MHYRRYVRFISAILTKRITFALENKIPCGFCSCIFAVSKAFFLCQVVIDTKNVFVEFASVEAIECLNKDRYYAIEYSITSCVNGVYTASANCSTRRKNFEIEFRHFGFCVCLTRSQHFRAEGVHLWQKNILSRQNCIR